MNDWKPITRQELDDLIAEQLAECSPEQAACFRKHRVEPHHAPLERYGKLEQVYGYTDLERSALADYIMAKQAELAGRGKSPPESTAEPAPQTDSDPRSPGED